MSTDDHDPTTTAQTPLGEEPSLVAGRYRILRTLGKGGGGHVWLAQDEKLGREVALKRVGGEADTEVLLTRGFREARTSATLAHENVVRVYDVFEHDGSPFIVMEYVPGPSLAALLEGGRQLPAEQVASIGAQLATALAAAHGAGILHRDVKPANVLLRDEEGRDAKLTDFGIARAEEDQQLTRTGFVSGTAAYFSPELAQGEDASPASDVWALGATLYAALEGQRPFPDRTNAVAQLHTIARESPRPPSHDGPLTAVLEGMLHPDPGSRWSARRAAQELAAVAAGAPAAPVPERPAPDDTQAVPSSGSTQAIPVRPPRSPGPNPVPAGAAYQRPAPARPAQGRSAPRRPRRTAMWLGWLLAVPLLAALGWLVWTIVQETPPGGGSATTSGQGAQVSADEAQELAEDFYARLRDDGLEAARELVTAEAYIDPGIAEGLTGLDVGPLTTTENPDGTGTVKGEVTYTYGSTVIVQAEELQVQRLAEGLRITTRYANQLSREPEE